MAGPPKVIQRFATTSKASKETKLKNQKKRGAAIKAATARRMKKFIADKQAVKAAKHLKAVELNQQKIKAHIKKHKHKQRKFIPLFGQKVNRDLAKAGKDIEKGLKVVNKKVLKPIGKDALIALDFAIEHSGEIADGMAIAGGVLVVVGGAVSATGLGAVVGGPIAALGGGLEAAAPVVRSQGARAKKVKDIAEKIVELTKLIADSKDIKEQMIAAVNILEEASKINNDKELKQAAGIIKDTIKLIEDAIAHGKAVIKSVKKGDIIKAISESEALVKDVKKGKDILLSTKDLLVKAKARLTPAGKKKLLKEVADKKAREEASGETRTSLNKHLKSELFAMAEKRNLDPSPRLLKADIITLLLNNPKDKALDKELEKLMKEVKDDDPTLTDADLRELGLEDMIKKKPKKKRVRSAKQEDEEKAEELPERKTRKKSTRKPSAYNLYVKKKMAEGMTFTEAARSWKSAPENPKNQ